VLFPAVATSGARSSRASACPTTRRRLDALLSSSAARSSCSRATARVVKMWPARCRGARRSCLGFKTSSGTAVSLSTPAAATGRLASSIPLLSYSLLLLVPSAWMCWGIKMGQAAAAGRVVKERGPLRRAWSREAARRARGPGGGGLGIL
jgi:hypothetical protein